jgi:hypothetical protein
MQMSLIDPLHMLGVAAEWTAVSQEDDFRHVLLKLRGMAICDTGKVRALEIGTYQGASTGLIATYCDSVHTIDTFEDHNLTQERVWQMFKVRDKITKHVVKSTKAKQELIKSLEFDFAFVDGDHMLPGIDWDFEAVKHCGRVLFHDYGSEGWPDVTEFVDALPKDQVTIYGVFALWIKP